MNSGRESYIQSPRLRPQNAEFTTLVSKELETQGPTSSCLIS